MPDTATYVHEQDVIIGYAGGIDEVANRIEPIFHPAGPAQTVDRHVVVKLLRSERVPLNDFEEMQVCVKTQLQGCVYGIRRVEVIVLPEIGRESVDASRKTTGPAKLAIYKCLYGWESIHKRKSIAVFLLTHCHCKACTLVLIRTGFLDDAHCGQMFQ